MANEIETKVLDIDVNQILKKFAELGAKKILETKYKVNWYRQIGTEEGNDSWFLRIRSNSKGVHEVTWKAKSNILGTARKHKEINFEITEPDKLADLFAEIGLENYAYQEKERLSFIYKDWRFDIDQYPQIPAYLEIEGKSESHVKKAIKLLNLSKYKTWAKGERILIQDVYKVDWYNMRFK